MRREAKRNEAHISLSTTSHTIRGLSSMTMPNRNEAKRDDATRGEAKLAETSRNETMRAEASRAETRRIEPNETKPFQPHVTSRS